MRILLKPRSGLANRLRAIDAAWALAQKSGRTLCVYWFDTEDCHVRWSDILEYPPQFQVVEVGKEVAAEIKKMFSRKNPSFCHWNDEYSFVERCLKGGENELALESFNRFYPSKADYGWLCPRREIREEVEKVLLGIGQNLTGIHIRRTDMYMASFLSDTGMFVKTIDKELRQHPDAKFFLATDDPKEKEFLIGKYPGVIGTREIVASRYDDGGIRDAFVDLMLLSSCRKIFGSVYSSFSAEAAAIGGIPLCRVVNPDKVPMSVVVRPGSDSDDLRSCLDSLCNQWFKRYEVLCVDNGSYADGASVIEAYSGKLMGVRRVSSLSDAVMQARGKYISFVYPFETVEFSFVKSLFNTAERLKVGQILFSPGRFRGAPELQVLCRRLDGHTYECLPWNGLHGLTLPSFVAGLLFNGARGGLMSPFGHLYVTEKLRGMWREDFESIPVSRFGKAFLFNYGFTDRKVSAKNSGMLSMAVRLREPCRWFAVKALLLRSSDFVIGFLRLVFKREWRH